MPETTPTLHRPVGPVAAFIRLGRMKFLFQSLLVVGAGMSIALHDAGTFSFGWYVLALLFGWCGHLMTHYCNEYFDLEADRANQSPTSWTGGSRVLVNNLLPPEVSLGAGFVLLFAEVVMIAVMPSPATRLAGAAVVVLAWFYTAPPARLNYHALGEVTCGVVVYGLVPLLTALLQTDGASALLITCVAVLAAQGTLRMLVMNLADIEGDLHVGKLTWAGAMGPRRTVWAYAIGQGAGYVTVLGALLAGVMPLPVAVALFAVSPVPYWVARQLAAGRINDVTRATAITFWASMQMALGSTALIVGFLVEALLSGGSLPGVWIAIVVVTLAGFGYWLVDTARRSGAEARSPFAPLSAGAARDTADSAG